MEEPHPLAAHQLAGDRGRRRAADELLELGDRAASCRSPRRSGRDRRAGWRRSPAGSASARFRSIPRSTSATSSAENAPRTHTAPSRRKSSTRSGATVTVSRSSSARRARGPLGGPGVAFLLVQMQRLPQHLCGFVGATCDEQHIGEIHPRLRTVDEKLGPVDERHRLAGQPLALLGPPEPGDRLRSGPARAPRPRRWRSGPAARLDQGEALRLLVVPLQVHGLREVRAYELLLALCAQFARTSRTRGEEGAPPSPRYQQGSPPNPSRENPMPRLRLVRALHTWRNAVRVERSSLVEAAFDRAQGIRAHQARPPPPLDRPPCAPRSPRSALRAVDPVSWAPDSNPGESCQHPELIPPAANAPSVLHGSLKRLLGGFALSLRPQDPSEEDPRL